MLKGIDMNDLACTYRSCDWRTNAPTGRVDRNWTKSGGKAP